MSASINNATEQVVAAVLQQHPVQLTFTQAAPYVNLSVAAAYTARLRGLFPVRVRQQNQRLVVFTADLIEYIRTGVSQAELSVPPIQQIKYKVKTGRPSKRESLEAAKLGLTVKAFRAQAAGVSHA